ncbi:hypothetical protein PUR29_35020 [Methylobacterium ajmalii]|uniref:Uncharacterized protein n=1 Tax=Methylobacterium ajmalii TaxID=2738439 RepID=A0ABV0A5A4_9HYPH
MNQSKEQLLATIDKIRKAIEADDSFEGHLTYTLEWSTGDKAEFEVSGAYRIGNSEGQGGMAVLAPSVPSVEQDATSIEPGDLVTYEGDDRLIRRYVGKSRNGYDVVETTCGITSFTSWLPGKAQLYQAGWKPGVPIRKRSF